MDSFLLLFLIQLLIYLITYSTSEQQKYHFFLLIAFIWSATEYYPPLNSDTLPPTHLLNIHTQPTPTEKKEATNYHFKKHYHF